MSDITAADVSNAFTADMAHLLDAPMKKIRHCLAQIDDTQVWWRPQESLNSIGNLMLHLAGNLRQWGITHVLQQEDHRDRASEFAADGREPSGASGRQTNIADGREPSGAGGRQTNIAGGHTRDELLAHLTETVTEAQSVMQKLTPDDLLSRRTIQGFDVSVLEALGHTVTHFTGHTHQIITLTRLIIGDAYQYDWDPTKPRTSVPA